MGKPNQSGLRLAPHAIGPRRRPIGLLDPLYRVPLRQMMNANAGLWRDPFDPIRVTLPPHARWSRTARPPCGTPADDAPASNTYPDQTARAHNASMAVQGHPRQIA